jgi:hypothetical protein
MPFVKRTIPMEIKHSLLKESRNRCAICGSEILEHLEFAHIRPMYLGGSTTSENLIVLCSACHAAVDSLPLGASVLMDIKQDWIERGILGTKRINQLRSAIIKSQRTPWTLSPADSVTGSFSPWIETLRTRRTFDTNIEEAQAYLKAVKNEDEFIGKILWPLFDSLGFEEVTIIHHTGQQEHGKDMVFYKRDSLGSFTVYAVVACCKKIHTTSTKTSDPGHYAKLLDQVRKCFSNPWRDHHLKRDTYIDKVIIATPSTITDEAMKEFQSWEEANKRQLIYLHYYRLAGFMAGLKPEH